MCCFVWREKGSGVRIRPEPFSLISALSEFPGYTRSHFVQSIPGSSELFPKELEKAVKDTEKTETERIEFKLKHEMQLIQKETEGEQKLHE